MGSKLIQLPSFTYTSLDFDTIVQDVKNLIREHPEYNQYWDDFLESNSGRMFIELMSWIIEKGAARTDWVAQEMFISTATQRQSIINLLKLINHRPQLPKASKVNIKIKLTKWIEPFDLPALETITGLDTTGNPIRFELINIASDGKPDYDYVYRVETGTTTNRIMEIENVPFYQGRTISEDEIYVEGIDNEQVQLQAYPVIENSIRVTSETTGKEGIEVDSFITPEAQQSTVPVIDQVVPYLVEIDELNRAIIKFAHGSIAKKPEKNERFTIKYRVGGGTATNIVTGAINQTKTYTFGNTQTSIIFTNPNPAFGGADEEKLEDAKLIAPISLRAANKLVTWEDYVSHLENDSLVMHANVVGKENEPSEIYTEYGYHLPPLDTWIYITPEREGWEETNPYEFNKLMRIGRPYNRYKVLDYEDVELTPLNQTVLLRKYKKYVGFPMYVTIHEDFIGTPPDTNESFRWLNGNSYIEDTDYTINKELAELTRITTADGGRIPSGDVILRIRYFEQLDGNDQEDNTTAFKTGTVKTFLTDDIILDTTPNSLYPAESISVTNIKGDVTYLENTDYSIDYVNNKITKISAGDLLTGDTVVIQYSAQWLQDEDDISEQNEIYSIIENKKMICVDVYIKDSVYTPYDVVATIYCYKNMRSKVTNGLEEYIRGKYNLSTASYDTPMRVADIYSEIMNYDGVRYAEISYLGRNYDFYRRYVLDEITLQELNDLGSNKVEHYIPCKYNEMLIPSQDEYSGSHIVENKIHGLIFTYKDA